MTHDPFDPEAPQGLDVDLLLRFSARWLLQMPSAEQYLRHMAEHGPTLFDEMITDDMAQVQAAPSSKILREAAPQFFRTLGWTVASTMPLPALGWKPHRLSPPGRNDACLCGSGDKFKRCCQPMLAAAPRLDPVHLGALVVQSLSAAEWATLPRSAIDPEMVAAAAHDFIEHDRAREAQRLLEAWGKAPAPWPQTWGNVLDLLADAYLELGHPRKRKALAQRMIERGDPAVQSLGWQRLCMIAADRGEHGGAARAFEQAQRLTPDDPRIALLEVTLLLGKGENVRASERAAFHARRLSRLPQAKALETEIQALQAIASGELDPMVPWGGDVADDEDPLWPTGGPSASEFDELQAWIQALPAARLRLDLSDATPEDLGELRPETRLNRPLQAWRAAFRAQADAPNHLVALEMGRWRPLLQRTPALLDCFEVLDVLVTAMDRLPPDMASGPYAALLSRAMELWDLLLQRFPAATCEWAWMDNRPALRLLAARIDLDRSPLAEHSFEWLSAMVNVLNPRDNHGLRDRLGAVLLRRGDAAAALALAERYPDDLVGMALIHTRALLALQRLPEAGAAWRAAQGANAHVAKLLQARRAPRQPDVASYALGSIEQAKLVVAEQHDLWREPAVQAWLKAQALAQASDGDESQLTLV